ncbi:hypothetical protein PsYK624_156700 [Phanerochaete sordida]|uniref:Uncharacterized protein n=1 Tax=Phanerochaete sordida TaxID=48140 RepID=A0A9P3GQQ3_9APHY|nr:hypothetical protein PsYK624_156700 [Phanerochaete sordida]
MPGRTSLRAYRERLRPQNRVDELWCPVVDIPCGQKTVTHARRRSEPAEPSLTSLGACACALEGLSCAATKYFSSPSRCSQIPKAYCPALRRRRWRDYGGE